MANIDAHEYRFKKGNGEEAGFPVGHMLTRNGKPTKHTLNGCWKYSDCDTCPLPVNKCTGSFDK